MSNLARVLSALVLVIVALGPLASPAHATPGWRSYGVTSGAADDSCQRSFATTLFQFTCDGVSAICSNGTCTAHVSITGIGHVAAKFFDARCTGFGSCSASDEFDAGGAGGSCGSWATGVAFGETEAVQVTLACSLSP